MLNTCMHSIFYKQTNQGQQTRSHLLNPLEVQDGLTRNELVNASGLTYEQVRRQTRNLSIEGAIESRIDHQGQRRYFTKTNPILSSLCIVFLLGWSVPVMNLSSGTDDDPIHHRPKTNLSAHLV
jgi:hypothetical protein